MAEICCKIRQLFLGIHALPVPFEDSVNDEGVA